MLEPIEYINDNCDGITRICIKEGIHGFTLTHMEWNPQDGSGKLMSRPLHSPLEVLKTLEELHVPEPDLSMLMHDIC